MKETILILGLKIAIILLGIYCYKAGESSAKIESLLNIEQTIERVTGVQPEYIIELDNDSIIIFGVSEYYSENKIYKLPMDSKEEIGKFFILDNQ